MSGGESGRVDVGTKVQAVPQPGRKAQSTPLLLVVTILLLATSVLLTWVGAETFRASRDASVRKGLDYEAFLTAVDDLVTGAGDSTLLSFDEVTARISRRRSVTFDTIRVLADVDAFPALDEAGFLHDQVQAYNRFQRERLALSRAEPAWWDRLNGFNPSIFRTYRRPDGSTGVTRAPAAWSLRVRSPLEGDWKGEVQASDVVRGVGLMSPQLSIPLRKPASFLVPVGRRKQRCEFVPSSPEIRIYCLSEERIAQATLRLASEESTGSWASAGWADLWVDGRRISSGDSTGIQEGSVLRVDPLSPAVFGDHWEGVLSSKQWINGRMRRRGDLPMPLDLFAGLGTGPISPGGRVSPDASVELSVSAEASMELTELLGDFSQSEVPLPVDIGAIVIARIADGEIVAVAEVGRRKNRGRSSLLERVAPGSAVKPLLAAAVLSQRPDLASLEIPARTGRISSVLGMPRVSSRRVFSTALNCAPPREGTIGLRYFLRCSNNEYAASLLVAGLVDGGIPGVNWRGASEIPLEGTRVPRSTLLLSPLSEGLSYLFDVPVDPAIADSRRRSERVWEGLSFSDGNPVGVPYELLPSASRPALLAPGSPESTDLSLLYRYAYGAWENQWTLLDLTNSFARIVSDRRVQLRFFPGFEGWAEGGSEGGAAGGVEGGLGGGAEGVAESMADSSGISRDDLGLADHEWYPEFLAGLRAVGVDGTARGLQAAWRDEGLPRTVLAKTGTLNEPGEATPSDDLFSKSLLFAVGNPTGGSGDPLACGLVGGLYLRFAEGPDRGNLPSYQVEFATRYLGEFLREHWEEFGGCPEVEPEGAEGGR